MDRLLMIRVILLLRFIYTYIYIYMLTSTLPRATVPERLYNILKYRRACNVSG